MTAALHPSRGLTLAENAVLTALQRFVCRVEGVTKASIDTIAAEACCCRSTVKNNIKKLIALGRVRLARAGGGRMRVNRYSIVDAADAADPASPQGLARRVADKLGVARGPKAPPAWRDAAAHAEAWRASGLSDDEILAAARVCAAWVDAAPGRGAWSPALMRNFIETAARRKAAAEKPATEPPAEWLADPLSLLALPANSAVALAQEMTRAESEVEARKFVAHAQRKRLISFDWNGEWRLWCLRWERRPPKRWRFWGGKQAPPPEQPPPKPPPKPPPQKPPPGAPRLASAPVAASGVLASARSACAQALDR